MIRIRLIYATIGIEVKMKKYIVFLSIAFSCTSFATTYNYVDSKGAYTYTTPTLATPANNLVQPAFQNNNATTVTGFQNPTANTAAANNTNANYTAVAGQLAGAVAASTAAHATGNPAAAMGAQHMMVNAGANVVSTSVMTTINAVMGH